jgi:hypothetical protein
MSSVSIARERIATSRSDDETGGSPVASSAWMRATLRASFCRGEAIRLANA